MSINEQIPVGSRWEPRPDRRNKIKFSSEVPRTAMGFSGGGSLRYLIDGNAGDDFANPEEFLANMRRIDVPATFAPPACPTCRCWTNSACADAFHGDDIMEDTVHKDTEVARAAKSVKAPAVRTPKPGEVWQVAGWRKIVIQEFKSGQSSARVHGQSTDGHTGHWTWNGGIHWHHVADAPAPKAEACGFPGCEGDLDVTLRRSVHRGCVAEGFDGCYCNGLTKQQTRCHDFIPAVSKTETPAAPVFAGDKQREHFDSICKVCFRSGPNPVCGHAIHPKVAPPVLKHDFSDRYCADNLGLRCIACGIAKRYVLPTLEACTPHPKWRENNEIMLWWGDSGSMTEKLPVAPLPRHFAQPPLSHGLQMGGGSVRCACARCRP